MVPGRKDFIVAGLPSSGKNMLGVLTVLMLACFVVALGLFVFMMRFAVKSEVVITTALLTLLTAIGLLSLTLNSVLEGQGHDLWSNISYLCAVLMFPLLVIMFVQRSTLESWLVHTAGGRLALFSPFMAQIVAHYLLPPGVSRFTDFVFLMVWLGISFMVWKGLFSRLQGSSSEIRRSQLEFMLASFFAVLLYNVIMIFSLFVSDIADASALFCLAITGSLVITVRGLVRYQMVIGVELLMRNSLIVLLALVISMSMFVLSQLAILQSLDSVDPAFTVLTGALLLVILVLAMGPINESATRVVEWLSPQLKWQESQVREIFVLHSNGLVLAHAMSRTEDGAADRDMVGGMLTAIQNFVQEAFHTSEMDSLKSLSMGKLRMIIEARGNIVLAVLFTGHEARDLRRGVIRLMDEMEGRFGPLIHSWRGDKRSVRGVQEWLEHLVREMGSEAP